ncbi:MAG: flagellar protein FlaG [Blautia sp.]|nr:flagellar protein FlaG [Lachnoclostridium sp.]MCM1210215.1 flagellar protein FlaG [Blautia sp.]
MAIEPLSSVMTFQAQDAPKPRVQTAQPVNMEVSPDDQTENVDKTTASVVQTQAEDSEEEKGEKGASEGAERQQMRTSQSANDQLKKAIAEMNRKINNSNEEAVFGVHEDTNRIMIKIVDKDTKEIIKEFPPEKTLDMIAKVWEMAGILVDEKR